MPIRVKEQFRSDQKVPYYQVWLYQYKKITQTCSKLHQIQKVIGRKKLNVQSRFNVIKFSDNLPLSGYFEKKYIFQFTT